jgi:hypothetical protein
MFESLSSTDKQSRLQTHPACCGLKTPVLLFLRMKRSIRKKKHNSIFDEVLLHHILGRLNAEPNSPQHKRVRRILDLLLDLKEQEGTYGAVQTLRELEKPLSRYRWAYRVAATTRGVRVHLGGIGLEEKDFWEYGAVKTILELIQKPKGMERLRRCDFCGEPFFIETMKGRRPQFCPGTTCKQQNYENKPENREKKRAYMRQYYRDWVKN